MFKFNLFTVFLEKTYNKAYIFSKLFLSVTNSLWLAIWRHVEAIINISNCLTLNLNYLSSRHQWTKSCWWDETRDINKTIVRDSALFEEIECLKHFRPWPCSTKLIYSGIGHFYVIQKMLIEGASEKVDMHYHLSMGAL